MRISRFLCVLAIALATLNLIGCSGDGMTEVAGKVTLDGNAINGSLKFEPMDGKSSVTGGPIKEGRYSVRVPHGTMKVSISMPKVVGSKKLYPTKDSPAMDVTAEGLRAEYNEKSTLTLEVSGSKVEKDFELKSK